MSKRMVEVFDNGSDESAMIEVQTFQVEDRLTGVMVNASQDGLIEQLQRLMPKIQAALQSEHAFLHDTAVKQGKSKEFEAFWNTDGGDTSVNVPGVFKGAFGKKMKALRHKLHTLAVDPISQFKGYITKTTHGYLLELWLLSNEYVVFNDLVTPVFQTDKAMIAPEPIVELPVLVVNTPEQICAAVQIERVICTDEDVEAKPISRHMTPREASQALARRFAHSRF